MAVASTARRFAPHEVPERVSLSPCGCARKVPSLDRANRACCPVAQRASGSSAFFLARVIGAVPLGFLGRWRRPSVPANISPKTGIATKPAGSLGDVLPHFTSAAWSRRCAPCICITMGYDLLSSAARRRTVASPRI